MCRVFLFLLSRVVLREFEDFVECRVAEVAVRGPLECPRGKSKDGGGGKEGVAGDRRRGGQMHSSWPPLQQMPAGT